MRDLLKVLPLGIILPIALFTGSVGPDDAQSNISKWLVKLGAHNLPNWIIDRATDHWVIYGCLVMAVLYALLAWIIIPHILKLRANLRNNGKAGELSEAPAVQAAAQPVQDLKLKAHRFARSLREFANNFHKSDDEIQQTDWNHMNEIKDISEKMKFRNQNSSKVRERRNIFASTFMTNYRPQAIVLHAELIERLSHLGIIPSPPPLGPVMPGHDDFSLFIDVPLTTNHVSESYVGRLADRIDYLANRFPTSISQDH